MSNQRVPSYRHYNPKNLGLVVLNGKYHYLGKYGTAESLAEYHRLIQEWLANHRTLPSNPRKPSELTTNQVILTFLKHAEQHYRHADGTPTGELANFRDALLPLRKLYGHTKAHDFGPLALRTVREEMVKAGLCRNTVNARINRTRRVFRWAVSMELILVSVAQGLAVVAGLQKGRSGVRESPGVQPVDWKNVELTLPHLPRPVVAMIEVMRYSNWRAQDVVAIRGGDLTMKGEVWEYRPARHKNQWREENSPTHKRVVYLGPCCQEIIRPFLKPDLHAYLFSPQEARAEHLARRAEKRKTKRTPSELRRKRKLNPKRAAKARYTVNTFQQAVRRACAKAGVKVWSVLQVRHTRATEVREHYGLEGAAASLGDKVEAAQIYAEKNQQLARTIAREIG